MPLAACDCLQLQSPWGRIKGTCSSFHKHNGVFSKSGVSQQGSFFSWCFRMVSGWCWQWAPGSSSYGCCNHLWAQPGQLEKGLPTFSFNFCGRGAFLSIFPACHAIQENKKALLTSALFSSYAQALSRLPIKPLPTRQRRQLLRVHLGVHIFSPHPLGETFARSDWGGFIFVLW